ncbi:nucleoside transporter C-terminal domain-containing protein [Oscillatoria sp. CS-180]|uniref:NupC/NupG family nucleoside CNT transporter n=1 Tax=Oscillatoria sp. CS-180 TaxID=3021720 RepID=UPI00232E0370|nr:nucleoside transporter C-terminal domain-containing protein [Oscillatoria sp. CS-180]MDB9526206.1 nucleoside transporter C-terminal domain-containing protein [Oscillatoria sp. CS-180]
MLNLLSLLGIAGLCFVAWLGSEDRRQVPWKLMFWGVGIQLALGLFIFRFPLTRDIVVWLSGLLNALIDASEAGAEFLFGPILVPDLGASVGPQGAGRWIARALTPPFTPVPGDRLGVDNLGLGYIFAFRALPQVIFFAAIFNLLYNLGVIQPIVRVFARFFRSVMNISGAESLAGAANIFVGIESAIAIKPFLVNMTRSELCAILASCFGSIASTVLGLYAGFLRGIFPAISGHLMSASVLTIPAAFVMAKILVPEKDIPETLGKVPAMINAEEEKQGPMDALILGALDGVKLAVGIAASLIAILGLVALLNLIFGSLASLQNSDMAMLQIIGQAFSVITLDNITGALFLPLTFLTGVSLDWNELWTSSVLIGQRLLKTAIPPYVALAGLSAEGALSDRALVIISYVLCGFAHVPSVGIFVGGLAGLVPSRRKDISSLGWKALWAGTLATLMTGSVAGLYFYEGTTVLGR